MLTHLQDIAARIKELREILGFSQEEAARKAGIKPEDFAAYENAEKDIPVGALYAVAAALGCDATLLMTGENPRMDTYTVVRKGQGIKTERFPGYHYTSLAYNFINRDMDPMIVTIGEGDAHAPVTHEGQEFNYVLEGIVKVTVGARSFELFAGDSIYFDPRVPHCQSAVTKSARFLTVINER